MGRILQVVLLMAAGAADAAQTPDTSSIILAPKPAASPSAQAPAPGAADRPVSSGVAAEISAKMPAYSPAASTPGTPAADQRDIDKPRNQIPRLPVEVMQRYVVREARVPVFRPRDLYTPSALIEMSFREHPGLHIGNFFNLNAGAALEKIRNEQFHADQRDLADTAITMAADGDTSEAEAMQQTILDESFFWAGKIGPVGIK